MPEVNAAAAFPEAFEVLFEPKRYKVFYGGRGGGRSWSCARALLILGARQTIRVLCARELQNSISESVHQLLSDQIQALHLDEFYKIQRDRILGTNGTTFVFEGIRNNVNKIRSFEGIDYCWVEEANKVSANSWEVLIPTIRKEQSEIWITFNPELEEDYTYRRFVKHADPETMHVVKTTWRDNEFFPEVLKKERDSLKTLNYDAYLNVWEGFCLTVLEGAVYARELRRTQEEGRVTKVPWDRAWPVDTYWDLGRADATAIWFVQRVAMQYRVLAYYQARLEDITHYLKELQQRPYTYGTMWLPHDARAKQLGTKRSIEEVVRQAGYRVQIVPRLSLTDGINAVRMVFPQCWFDESGCEDGLYALRHYRYKVDGAGSFSKEPMHDEASDGSDAFRMFAVSSHERVGNQRAVGVMERLKGLAAATLKQREEAVEEFSGRRSSGSGWMR
jgi:phage terminase large subunit